MLPYCVSWTTGFPLRASLKANYKRILQIGFQEHQQPRRTRTTKYIDSTDNDDEFHMIPQGESDVQQGARVTFSSKDMATEDLVFIKGISELGFRLVDESFLCGPIAVFPKTVLSWRVPRPKDITPKSLELFFMLQPKLDVLIIGAGEMKDVDLVRKSVGPAIAKQRIGYEVLNTEDAIASFNFLNEEHRYVGAALYPPRELELNKLDFRRTLIEQKDFTELNADDRTGWLVSMYDSFDAGDGADFEIRAACYRIWGTRTEEAEQMLKKIRKLREIKKQQRIDRIEQKAKREQKEHFLEARRLAEDLELSMKKRLGEIQQKSTPQVEPGKKRQQKH